MDLIHWGEGDVKHRTFWRFLDNKRIWCDMSFRWNGWNIVQSATVVGLPGGAEDGRR